MLSTRYLLALASFTGVLLSQSMAQTVPFEIEREVEIERRPDITEDPQLLVDALQRRDYMQIWIKDGGPWRLAASNDPDLRTSISKGCPAGTIPPTIRDVRAYFDTVAAYSNTMRLRTSDLQGAFYVDPPLVSDDGRFGDYSVFAFAYGSPQPAKIEIIMQVRFGGSAFYDELKTNADLRTELVPDELEEGTYRSRFFPMGPPHEVLRLDKEWPATLAPFTPNLATVDQGLPLLVENRALGTEPVLMMTTTIQSDTVEPDNRTRFLELLFLPVSLCTSSE